MDAVWIPRKHKFVQEDNMKKSSLIFKYAGVACIPVYIALTFAAHLNNRQLSPMENWLSDYGNPLLNPGGAIFYNAGCVLTALMLAVFYIGMFRWYGRGRAARKVNISYAVAQASGLIGSVFLILTAVFTLGTNTQLHSTFSMAHMIATNFFLSFTAIGFFMIPKMSKIIGIFGFLTSVFNIVTMNAFENFYISEWIYFLLFMAYLVLVTLHYDRIAGKKEADAILANQNKNA
jgi:hypothetical protein